MSNPQSIIDTVDQWSSTPIPALVFGGSLLLKGAFPAVTHTVSGSGGGGVKVKTAVIKPTRVSCLGFGAANLLGAWIMYDGEPVNGAGFNFAWSTLYLIVNGGASIKSIFRGKVSPAALSILALGNSSIYGRKFFWSKEGPLQ
ncbi:uncharacterized protein SPAPADRAFT_133363 [Spathaspora passalidarum NRRL Y-27907]|uniref:Uncharacterized protein n=1 Tax=Spathaspora passalidarum (strain NRRL Y-27907 / 11-Y1) TaxID=619300 RepID=G3AJV1_SPAPN|nr:uncharacterized protein SPAPADRAFT_133363 [Spathaspora passalidarum NRRL Y-27907]EGW34002.1 hypothetical protein SPAPADRAFT_133363 [Spathaspora passalidarum NRRL Y-27907]